MSVNKFEAQIQTIDMMCQCADGDEIDTGFGITADGFFRNPARGFRFILTVNQLQRFASLFYREVVQHDAMHAAVFEHALHIVNRAGFNFDFEVQIVFLQIGMGFVDGLFNTTGKVYMIVFQHDHIEQTKAVIGSPARFQPAFQIVAYWVWSYAYQESCISCPLPD